MVFNGEVRPLFLIDTQIFTALSYQINTNLNSLDTEDDLLEQQRKTVLTT